MSNAVVQEKKTRPGAKLPGRQQRQRSPVKLSVEELERITESGHRKRGIELSRRMITQQNPELR